MPKGYNETAYRNAAAVLFGEWICIEENPLHSGVPSPETLAIKKDAWEKLSNEAKETIMMIVNSPDEILQYFQTPIRKRISKKSVRKGLQKIWHSRVIADWTIQEITSWVNQL